MTAPALSHDALRYAAFALLLAVLAAPRASATSYLVDSASDAPGMTTSTPDGVLTLREALTAANTDAAYGDAPAGNGTDTVSFVDVSTITLEQGELAITDGVTINGSFVTVTTLPNIPERLFSIATTDRVTLFELVLTGGFATQGGAVLLGTGSDLVVEESVLFENRALDGGAIYVSAGATLGLGANTSFVRNRSTGSGPTNGGGAIYTAGTVNGLSTSGVFFDVNRATVGSGSGGAVLVADGGVFTAGAGFSFDSNRAARAGGAIEVREGGTATFQFTEFADNVAGPTPGNGGAIHITGAGTVTLENATFEGNVASAEGGALWNSGTGTLTVTNCDFFSNRARGTDPDQGGGAIFADGGGTTVTGGFFADNRAVDGSGSGGAIFSNGASFTLTGASLIAVDGNPGNRAARAGGGIEVRGGWMTITDSVISDNATGTSPGNGGGLHITAGNVGIRTSEVNGNTARNEGGGLWNSGTGSRLSVTGTTIDGNTSFGNGGGVYQDAGGRTTIFDSAITNNTATTFGGGVFVEGNMRIRNSTLSGNTARRGGGGQSADDAFVTLRSVTIAANTALGGTTNGGAGGGFWSTSRTRVQLQNTLVGDNVNGQLRGLFGSQGHNLVEARAGAAIRNQRSSDVYEADALLGPLADNGGPTMTHALLTGSPAIDAGLSYFATDQRGETRADPDDIGAFDFGAAIIPPFPGVMIISGVVDATLASGVPKAIEFYVTQDIVDLGRFGFGSTDDGGGTDGEEFSFPDGVPAMAGDYLYVASESPNFTTWFGFAPDYTSSAASIDGGDAIQLFLDGGVLDTFGYISTDGSGQPWEYTDSWAYRVDGTGPDEMKFVLGHFTYAGPDALDGESSNATAASPFPAGTYSPTAPSARESTASKLGDAVPGLEPVAPNPIRTSGRVQFSVAQSETVTVELYDMMGRRVQSLYTGTPTAETVVDVTVDASGLASGVYVIVMQSETQRQTQRVTVAR